MKKIFTLFVAVFLTATLWAQSPEKMSYQAVIRNSSDALVTNTQVGMQISILQGSASGTAVYMEIQTPITNANGLVSIEIGTGTTSDDFSAIDWSSGSYFIKTETDPTGGTSYTITGTSQLLSVPYALHAKTAETVTGGISETDPVFGAWDKSTGISISESQISDLDHFTTADETDPVFGSSPANGIASGDISNWNTAYDWGNHATAGYLTSYSETDPLYTAKFDLTGTANGDLLKFNGTKFVKFTPNYLTSEVDGSVTNEIQDLQLVGNILTITNNGTATNIDLSAYLDNTDTQLSDADISTMGYIKNADETDPSVPTGTQTGEMQYWNGTAWITVAAGSEGQMLRFVGGVPTWTTVAGVATVGPTDVYNPTTDKIWMDRNLGASQVATSSTDAASYGDLYQWGRGTDGHQIRTSGTTTTLATSDNPGHGNFILNSSTPIDWRNPKNDNLWQGVSGTNNPCPSGYRLPTETEWEAERTSWSSNDAAGAFGSQLKLTVAGNRYYGNGSLLVVGSNGYYWSSTVNGDYSQGMFFSSSNANMFSGGNRAAGFSVRCIKE